MEEREGVDERARGGVSVGAWEDARVGEGEGARMEEVGVDAGGSVGEREGERVGAGVGNSPGLGAKLPQANVRNSKAAPAPRVRRRVMVDWCE